MLQIAGELLRLREEVLALVERLEQVPALDLLIGVAEAVVSVVALAVVKSVSAAPVGFNTFSSIPFAEPSVNLRSTPPSLDVISR